MRFVFNKTMQDQLGITEEIFKRYVNFSTGKVEQLIMSMY